MRAIRKIVCLLCLYSVLLATEPAVYFTSEVDLAKKCVEYIKREKDKIRIASYRLSNYAIISELVKACKRGVSVEVIVDAETVSKRSVLTKLAQEGVAVFVWKSKSSKKDRMHHAFCVFGDKTAWTGSYGFSVSKKFNHKESALVLSEEKTVASFLKEFDVLKTEGVVPLFDYIKEP